MVKVAHKREFIGEDRESLLKDGLKRAERGTCVVVSWAVVVLRNALVCLSSKEIGMRVFECVCSFVPADGLNSVRYRVLERETQSEFIRVRVQFCNNPKHAFRCPTPPEVRTRYRYQEANEDVWYAVAY